MATKGELTVGKLKRYLECYPDDTKVVLGKEDSDEVHLDCWANSFYPASAGLQKELDVWVVIDPGHHWFDRQATSNTGGE